MNEDFFDELKVTFPKIYDVSYDMWVEKGWQPIIYDLSHCIQKYIDWKNKDSLIVPQVKVTQIKEKFGGLRFYFDGGDEYVEGLVRMAECWADRSCEICGKPGRSRSGGWIKTLCDEHDAERNLK